MLLLSMALAQSELETVATELTELLQNGPWTQEAFPREKDHPGLLKPPVSTAGLRLRAPKPFPTWRLEREVFETVAKAEEHVIAWTRVGFPRPFGDDPFGWGLGHTKSWHRKVRQGPVVWEMYLPCAMSEANVVALEARLESLVQAEGSYGRCICGGHCSLGDDRDRKNPPEPPRPPPKQPLEGMWGPTEPQTK